MNVEAALSSIRDGRLDQVESLKGLERQLRDTLKNQGTWTRTAIEDLSPILADFHRHRENILSMLTRMDEMEDQLLKRL